MTKSVAAPVLLSLLALSACASPGRFPANSDEITDCKIQDLHPTQFSVGMREVQDKEAKLSDMKKKELEKYKQNHPEPTVIGPHGQLYIIDHHHLARALADIGEKHTYCQNSADLSGLSQAGFWQTMEEKKWVYPYDANGHGPLPVSQLPATVLQLQDDPYRSLAAAVRDEGGYDKTSAPFAEFLWADYFRDRVGRKDVDNHFKDAVKQALKLAQDPAAKKLPGYNGK